jgi:glycosyltransferase involved in cell wall biosynthesis
MGSAHRTLPAGGAFARRFTRFTGLFFDEFASDSVWIREQGEVELPAFAGVDEWVVRGEVRPHPQASGSERGAPGLQLRVNGRLAGVLAPPPAGPWEVRLKLPRLVGPGSGPGPGSGDPGSGRSGPTADPRSALAPGSPASVRLTLRLTGVAGTNFLAWLGRVLHVGPLARFAPFQRFRAQRKNRQLRIGAIETASGERIYDFSRRLSPYSAEFARRHTQLGLNIVGFLTADLGIGESARCMVRAADAAGLATALVPLKLHCRNPLGDQTYAARLGDANPHGVNVIHLDPPAARDVDHHHGAAFRRGKYNIGYFAWELPEFPDAWLPAFDYFDEIWCPSDFTSTAVALKSPVPVLTMPHAVEFPAPPGTTADLRRRFGLPDDLFLFLVLFDLNSYVGRKNPGAAIEAFRRSGLAGRGAALVLKVHNAAANAADLATLEAAVRELPGTVVISATLSRSDVYALEAACDSYVSLHRSEGFGLAVAECMLLGKPVLSTDWSATAEYLDASNGCPVRCAPVVLDRHHGPYAMGSTWADPDVDDAAEWMRRLLLDRPLGARLGAAARHSIQQRFAPPVIGARYRSRLEAIACF